MYTFSNVHKKYRKPWFHKHPKTTRAVTCRVRTIENLFTDMETTASTGIVALVKSSISQLANSLLCREATAGSNLPTRMYKMYYRTCSDIDHFALQNALKSQDFLWEQHGFEKVITRGIKEVFQGDSWYGNLKSDLKRLGCNGV